MVAGGWNSDDLVALYRDGERLAGALTVNRRGDIMKYRARIARLGTCSAAVKFAAQRTAATAPARA